MHQPGDINQRLAQPITLVCVFNEAMRGLYWACNTREDAHRWANQLRTASTAEVRVLRCTFGKG